MQDEDAGRPSKEPEKNTPPKPTDQAAPKPVNENSTFRLILREVVVVAAATISTIVVIFTLIGLFFNNLLDRATEFSDHAAEQKVVIDTAASEVVSLQESVSAEQQSLIDRQNAIQQSLDGLNDQAKLAQSELGELLQVAENLEQQVVQARTSAEQAIDDFRQRLSDFTLTADSANNILREIEEISESQDEVVSAITQSQSFQELVATSLLPGGAIVAFDGNSCPRGWRTFNQATGRVVVGAGSSNDDDGLSRRFEPLETGGAYLHKLTVDELPPHSHSFQDSNVRVVGGRGLGGSGTRGDVSSGDSTKSTAATGGGRPHNNMPPYVALNLCQKIEP